MVSNKIEFLRKMDEKSSLKLLVKKNSSLLFWLPFLGDTKENFFFFCFLISNKNTKEKILRESNEEVTEQILRSQTKTNFVTLDPCFSYTILDFNH